MIRFVVDAQLPPALARFLASLGYEAKHLVDVGLAEAEDPRIWEYALATESVILTKDEDFVTLSSCKSPAPRVVWIRVGNTSKSALLKWFETVLPIIEKRLSDGDQLIEIR